MWGWREGPPPYGHGAGSRCGRAQLQASPPSPPLSHPGCAPWGAPQLRTPSRPVDSSFDPVAAPPSPRHPLLVAPWLGAVSPPPPHRSPTPPKRRRLAGGHRGGRPHCAAMGHGAVSAAGRRGGGRGVGRGGLGRGGAEMLWLGFGERGEQRGVGGRAGRRGQRRPRSPPSSTLRCSGSASPPFLVPPPSPRFQGNPDVWAQLRHCSAPLLCQMFPSPPPPPPAHTRSPMPTPPIPRAERTICCLHPFAPICCCCCWGGEGRMGGLPLSLELCCICAGWRQGCIGAWGATGVRCCRGCVGAGMLEPQGCNGGAFVGACWHRGDALVQGCWHHWDATLMHCCGGCRHHGDAMGMHWCRDAGTVGMRWCRDASTIEMQWGCIGAGMLAPLECVGAGMQAPWGCNGDVLLQGMQAPPRCNGDASVQGCWDHRDAMGMHCCRGCGTMAVPGPAAAAGPPGPPSPLPAGGCSALSACTERPPAAAAAAAPMHCAPSSWSSTSGCARTQPTTNPRCALGRGVSGGVVPGGGGGGCHAAPPADLEALLADLRSFLLLLDRESLSAAARAKKQSVGELLQRLQGPAGERNGEQAVPGGHGGGL